MIEITFLIKLHPNKPARSGIEAGNRLSEADCGRSRPM